MIKNKSRSIALNGILIALMIAMTCTMFATGGMAFLPLVVLVVGSVIVGKWTALILGLTFGLLSFGSAFIFPSPTAPLFQNPLISILPRVLIGVVMYGVYSLSEFCFKKINAKRKKAINGYVTKCASTALGAIFGVLCNTLLVLLMIWVLYNGKVVGDVNVNKEFIFGLITINFVVEIIVTPILSAPIVFAVDKFLKRNTKQVVTDADFAVMDLQNELVQSTQNNFDENTLENFNEITQTGESRLDVNNDNNLKDNYKDNNCNQKNDISNQNVIIANDDNLNNNVQQ